MEIECQGCYYTLCSFVCLTEDLSEILQFLWRHGCLRRSYLCEKCGRKCAIGDKDLFFRCNRNALEVPLNSHVADLSSESSDGHQIVDCPQPLLVQTNGDGQIILPHHHQHQHQQLGQMPHQYGMAQSDLSNGRGSTRIVPMHGSNADNLILMHHDGGVHHPGLMVGNGSDALQNGIGHGDRVLTVMDSQGGRIIQDGSDLMSEMPMALDTERKVTGPEVYQHTVSCDRDSTEEPPQKVTKRKADANGKTPKKRCNFKVSMKKGTFFEKSKLPIDTVCKFVVFWCCMKHPTQEFLRNELSLATRTVVDWSTACREICIHWAKSVSEKIGGDGVMVQIDEVKIQETKDSKQTDNGNKFSFWGMEKDKEKGKIFIVPVPACDSWSLLTVVNDWILPGSVIISNCWKAYDCLKLQEFIQQTAVQSKTFVHPQSNSGQQNFEGKVDEAGASAGCEMQMPRFGTRRSHHLGDLAEFMFKRRYSNHLERMHAFFRQISLAYPLR